MKLLILNGPNMNMLGIREPEIYGHETYEDLMGMIQRHAESIGADAVCVQSNHEGTLVDEIQKAYFGGIDGIVINPAGYTHTSVAIGDALKAVGIPAVEVHVSDVDKREDFRKISLVRDAVINTVSGKGLTGYLMAMDILMERISGKDERGGKR